MKISEEILNRIKSCLVTVAPDCQAYLYGSQARGDAGPDSDVDILILLPDHYEGSEYVKKRFLISDTLYDLSLDLGIDISPLITVHKVFYLRKTPFTINVINEGIQL